MKLALRARLVGRSLKGGMVFRLTSVSSRRGRARWLDRGRRVPPLLV